MSQIINESMYQWISESTNQINEWVNQRISESMNAWICGSMSEWISELRNGWISASMNQWVKEWMNAWTDEWMDGPLSFSNRITKIMKSSSCYSLAHFFLEIEARTCGNRDPTSLATRTPLYPKKHKVSRPRRFSPVNSHVPELLLSPLAPKRQTALAHHVVDMMMLTWEWHDDKTAPGQSSVTQKFSN